MKQVQVRRLARKYWLPHLPDFAIHRSMLVREPVDLILRGVLFAASASESGGSYVHVFVQPLYVPVEYEVLDHGFRLGGGAKYWRFPDKAEAKAAEAFLSALQRDGLPFLDRVHTPEDMVGLLAEERAAVPENTHYAETHAYSLILAGRFDEALLVLDELRHVVAPSIRQSYLRKQRPVPQWKEDLFTRADEIRAELIEDPPRAVSQLKEWRDYTATQLRLDDLDRSARSRKTSRA